jgi:ATP-binding cassette subfamily B protein
MQYLKEHIRTTKRRWTRYFTSRMTSQQSVTEIKLLGLAPVLRDQFRSIMTTFRDENRKLYLHNFATNSLFAVLATTALYGTFVWVTLQALEGNLTIGDVAIYAGAMLGLRKAFESTILSVSSDVEQTLYISNLREFLNLKPRITDTSGLTPISSRGEIEFRNVSFTYPGSTQPTLSDVSFHIMPGETVALVGENGAGKTTLVKLIARLYDPDQGCILFDGIDLRELSLAYLRSHMSFVLQRFGRYEATAADNIAYGDWQRLLDNRNEVEQVIHRANMHDMIEAMPQGYDTMLGRMFGEYDLSEGQWQKLALARAFARDSLFIILDEPTSNLDARAEYQIFSRFRELAKGRTTVFISHRFSTVGMADRILVMDKGRIVESGTHQQLLSQAGHYASLYNLHQSRM